MDLTQSLPSWHLNEPFCYLPCSISDPKHNSNTRNNLYVSHDSELQDPYVSPCFSDETSIPIPPTCMHVGGAERVRDDAIYFHHKFQSSPIKLEVYEEMVHVFQLFTPFSSFSKLSVTRMGSFIYNHTGNNPTFEAQREMLWMRNEGGYPVEVIHCDGSASMLIDGIEMLKKRGIYETTEDKDGYTVKNRKQGF